MHLDDGFPNESCSEEGPERNQEVTARYPSQVKQRVGDLKHTHGVLVTQIQVIFTAFFYLCLKEKIRNHRLKFYMPRNLHYIKNTHKKYIYTKEILHI